jgi:tetratricopeptide (TPR) repeat protein
MDASAPDYRATKVHWEVVDALLRVRVDPAKGIVLANQALADSASLVRPDREIQSKAWNAIGTAQLSLGDNTRAKSAFERANELLTDQTGDMQYRLAANRFHIGRILRQQYDYAGAEDNFERALQSFRFLLGGDNYETRYVGGHLAAVLIAKGKGSEAQALLAEVLGPGMPTQAYGDVVKALCAEALLQRGKLAQAAELGNTLSASDAHHVPVAYMQIIERAKVDLMLLSGQHELAAHNINEAITRMTAIHAPVRGYRASMLLALADIEIAQRNWSAALARIHEARDDGEAQGAAWPENTAASDLREAQVLIGLGKADAAIELLNKAVSRVSTSSQRAYLGAQLASLQLTEGRAFAYMRDWQRAGALFETAINMLADGGTEGTVSASARLEWSNCLVHMGQVAEARRQYEMARLTIRREGVVSGPLQQRAEELGRQFEKT